MPELARVSSPQMRSGRNAWCRAVRTSFLWEMTVGQCGAAGEATGGDDGAEVGINLGAPFRAEPVRHSAEDHREPQRPLALVVGCLDVRTGRAQLSISPIIFPR
jgi:hypothetical protein